MAMLLKMLRLRYRLIYYEVLDLLINNTKDHFQQRGYQTYSKLEDLLVNSVNKKDTAEKLGYIYKFYGDDLNADVLKMQLDIMATNLPKESSGYDLRSVVMYHSGLSKGQRSLLSEVCILASLVLVTPATGGRTSESLGGVLITYSLNRIKLT